MKREFSVGGIVFKNNQVLLIQSSSNGYWQFPKGHPDKGETMEEAALREIKEEAGVEAEIIEKVGDSKYIYTPKGGEKVFKVVTMFLASYLSGDIKDHDFEVGDLGWFDPQQALEKLTFPADKKLLEKALTLLK